MKMDEKGKEVQTDYNTENSLREIAQGYIRFSIKTEDTEENNVVHNAFKEFCRVETNNDYTMGIRKLLEYYQGDFKYEILYNSIQGIQVELDELKESLKKPTKEENEEDGNAF